MICRLLITGLLFCSSIAIQAQATYDSNVDKVYTSLQEALKTPDRVYHLKLEGQRLTSFPQEILELRNLTTLSLADNLIKDLDKVDLKSLRKLGGIDLSQNELRVFPKTVLELTNLQYLNLGFNSIRIVDQEVNQMKYLVELHLAYNGMSDFPSDLQLKYLEVLRLDGNKIQEIPEDALGGLPRLVSLNINNNKLTNLPEAVYSSNIERLNLGGNKIQGLESLGLMQALTELIIDWNPLSPEAVQAIGSLNRLETLSMERCGIKEIPETYADLDRLQEWSLVGNEITNIPGWITEMKSLEKLWLSGNPLPGSSVQRLKKQAGETVITF